MLREGRAIPEDSRLWINCPAAGPIGDVFPADN
jgi:glyoxylate carboligase